MQNEKFTFTYQGREGRKNVGLHNQCQLSYFGLRLKSSMALLKLTTLRTRQESRV